MTSSSTLDQAYAIARERYAQWGVDTESALSALQTVSLSLHCWQGDDVHGFETVEAAAASGGGIQVTGGYPGRARTIGELQQDLVKAYSLIPGKHRLNLHAMYGDFGGKKVDRDAIEPSHFRTWMDWGRDHDIPLDFNSTCFAHPRADSGFTLSSLDNGTRDFWIEHVRRCREIGAVMGKMQGSPSIHNLWIPDGAKDITVRRFAYRAALLAALDSIYSRKYELDELKDAVESKLFGIGSESFVVGSHEFYLGYALSRKLMLCLDLGHFHPTESIADKISSLLQFTDELLLHVSRGVRWDSDHVVILNDDVSALAEEIVRARAMEKVHVALDFFDGSVNRIGAWVVGSHSTLKAFLRALLAPREPLEKLEASGDFLGRLAVLEEMKAMPFGAVWETYCTRAGVPVGQEWIKNVSAYEAQVLRKRG
jgi:L-rhamnose isomerase